MTFQLKLSALQLTPFFSLRFLFFVFLCNCLATNLYFSFNTYPAINLWQVGTWSSSWYLNTYTSTLFKSGDWILGVDQYLTQCVLGFESQFVENISQLFLLLLTHVLFWPLGVVVRSGSRSSVWVRLWGGLLCWVSDGSWVLWFWDPVGWSVHCLCLSEAVDHSQSESLLSLFQKYNKTVYCPICTKESNLTTNRNEKELK